MFWNLHPFQLPEFLIFWSHLEAAPEMWESCGKKSGLKKGYWGYLGPGLPTPAHRCRVGWQGFLPASWGLPASWAQFRPACALLWWNGFSTLLIRTIMKECLFLFSATVKYFRRLNIGLCLLGCPLLPSFLLTWALFYPLFAAPFPASDPARKSRKVLRRPPAWVWSPVGGWNLLIWPLVHLQHMTHMIKEGL